jgi:hypothetical protein
MGPCGTEDEWRQDPAPRVRSFRLQLPITSLLLQTLPITDQFPASIGIRGQATPLRRRVLAGVAAKLVGSRCGGYALDIWGVLERSREKVL